MQTYSRYSQHFITQSVTHLWDLIDLFFCEDVKDIKDVNNNDNVNDDYVNKVKDNNNYDEKDDNDNKSISALRFDKDLVFLRGHLGHSMLPVTSKIML